MIRLSRDQWDSLFFFGLGVGISLMSLRYGHGTFSAPAPGFLSFWSGVMTSFFSVIGFFATWRRESPKKREPFLGPLSFKSFAILLTLVGYAFLLDILGFLICTFLFMLILLRTFEANNWKVVCTGSLGTAVACYLIFYFWLKTQLPVGILGHFGF